VLAPVHQLLGKGHALWITSIPFGLAHFSGTFPGGEIWFLLTAFLGYLFAKGMLETKGFTWPWLMHFVSDLPVLTFTAMITIAQRGF
jgi:membrane protease YdiL (CAAX protease family)